MKGANRQVFPSSGSGFGPGTSSQGLMDEGVTVSKTEESRAACVERARLPWTGHVESLPSGYKK